MPLKKEKFKFYAIWLSLICIVVYILQLVIPGFTEFFLLTPVALSRLQIWRFLTSIFLHGSPVHLLYNLFALALFGSILEKFIRGKRFLIVFFVSGIIANLISVNFYTSSLGASGAIYGILGALAVIKPLMMVWAFGFPMPMFLAAILWTAGSVLGVFMPGNIGHIAHLSGILFGFILGWLYKKPKKRKKQKVKIPDKYMRQWESSYILRIF
jgi:hypothetical protein